MLHLELRLARRRQRDLVVGTPDSLELGGARQLRPQPCAEEGDAAISLEVEVALLSLSRLLLHLRLTPLSRLLLPPLLFGLERSALTRLLLLLFERGLTPFGLIIVEALRRGVEIDVHHRPLKTNHVWSGRCSP